jgi:anti-sigma regulatory factor (Ser/Thr protein kinase)
MQKTDQSIALRLPADVRFIPVVQGVAEHGAAVFGLDHGKCLRLTMAAEEMVSHLAATAGGTEVRMAILPGGWCVRAEFSFVADPSGLWAMNLATGEDQGGDEGLGHLGLLLASRMSDGFSVRLDGRTVTLTLRQDRAYPVIEARPGQRGAVRGALRVVADPEPALIREACSLVLDLYPSHLVHQTFFTPGKLADMIAQGYYAAAVAVDEVGALVGLVLWRAVSGQSVGFSGPYVFVEGEGAGQVAEVLETHLLGAVARTKAVGLFSHLATPELLTHNFESLGRLAFAQADGTAMILDAWFRHLREDTGAAVWAHPAMRAFLDDTYGRLFLMRTIRETDGTGETLPERSVLSSRLRPELSEAILVPMVAGADMARCVTRHVDALRRDGYHNIFFHLDLARGWQAALGGLLMDAGFAPALLIPLGGVSDVVVFRHG